MQDKEKDKEESAFKVVDRRLFTPEGERRPEASPEPAAASAPPPKAKAAEPPPAPPRADAPSETHGPVSFDQLVMSLATSAMFHLGLVRSPEDDKPVIDLPAAKETIDLLDILQQKTKGNLTEEEAGLLEGSLYELRMVFVQVTKAGQGPLR